MFTQTLYRLSAFSSVPSGGNPAGVWVGDTLPEPSEMQRIAKEVGYSETAFVTPVSGLDRTVRYFSPEAEVSFCGHATIATAVLLGELNGIGSYKFHTAIGEVPVAVKENDGKLEAALTSVEPSSETPPSSLVNEVLVALGWNPGELDPSIPAAKAYAGAWHLIIAAATSDRLERLDYDFDRMKTLMLEANLTTLQLIWREGPNLFHSRNPFPVGGVVEDPATGASAAALGGYLRAAKLLTVPNSIMIHQGDSMGRPSRIKVDIPVSGGIVVSGTAVHIA